MSPELSRRPSIRGKLLGAVISTALLVLAVTCGVLLSYEIHSYRKATARSLSTIADIIAENSAAALIFDDDNLAGEIISGLHVEPEISRAALFGRDGRVVANYPTTLPRSDFPPPRSDGALITWSDVTISKPVVQDNRRVGTVFIHGNLSGTYRRLGIYGLVLVAVMIASIFAALVLAKFFQRTIAEPVQSLARTAGIVSEKRDYSVRAKKVSDDEIGTLTDAFNTMLDQIQSGHSALAESEERFRTLADNIAQLAWMANDLGWATWYNKRWYDYTGTTLEEMRHRGWERVQHPDHLERVRHHQQECISAGKVWEDTFPIRGKNGEYRWFLSRAVPIRSPEGRVVRWFGTSTDITEQREVEDQLVRARDEALHASRTKDEFLAALSHELRTPLSPILLLASDSAQNHQFSAEARALFETIRKNVELEARLIDDLLDLTSITRGKLALNRRPVKLQEILADALLTVKPDVDAKEIQFTFENRAGDACVFADAIRLQQAFWNVIKNAAKFTPAKGRIIVVTTRDEQLGTIGIAITDTGIGMTPAELGRVFKAFTQGDHASASSGHRFGGLGLGLAISRSVVELHGGTITAESAGANEGATFRITLPLFVTDESATPALVPQEDNLADLPEPTGVFHPRILLVEDHAPTRLAIESLLRRRSHEVVAADSLAAARKAAEAGAFHLLISDIGLPDGSGYDLLKELRRRGPIAGIAVTGYGMESDIAESMRAGFSIHLTKPIKIAALEAALHEALRTAKRI